MAKALFALAGLYLSRATMVGRAIVFVALTSSFTVAGLILISRGQRDRRAVNLGTFFLLIGSSFSDPLLIRGAAAASSGRLLFHALASTQVAAFQAYYFWAFVRDFPRRIGPYVRQDFARACAIAALVIGTVLFFANLLLLVLPAQSDLRPLLSLVDRRALGSLYWPLLILFGLPVLPYITWKARRAAREERRRAAVLLLGVYVGIAPAMLLPLVELLSPRAVAFDVSPLGQILVGALVYPPLLSIPFSTAYAIIVHNALDVSLIVRKALRYAIAKSSVIFASLIPFVLLIGLVYARRHESIVNVASGRLGILLALLIVGGFLSSAFRSRLLTGLDRFFFREQFNARQVLDGVRSQVQANTPRVQIAATVAKAIDVALHPQSVSVLMMDAVAGVLSAPTQNVRPLSRHSRLVTDFLSRDHILDVDWTGENSWVRTIPELEMEWLMEAGPRVVISVRGRAGNLLGALLVGDKKSELPFSHEDLGLLADVAKAVGEAIETPPASGTSNGVSSEAQTPASECQVCGLVDTPEKRFCRACHTLLEPSAVPCILAGKYEPRERIGKGGMGVVYRAFDLNLLREVALKTLPRAAPFGAARMRREARAMAAVKHQNLEMIHAAESWRGTPMLIVEYLGGGTLADRLRASALKVDEALELAQGMVDALVCLHRAGILHRDIKPANIGFDSDGTPKLLDFGLAWMLEAAAVAPHWGSSLSTVEAATEMASLALTSTGQIVGTLPYLSPESVNGAPVTAAVDLWALSMVIYESLAGSHPLASGNAQGMLKRILCDDVEDIRVHTPSVPDSLALFLREALSRDIARRPQSAHAWRNQIGTVRNSLGLTVSRAS